MHCSTLGECQSLLSSANRRVTILVQSLISGASRCSFRQISLCVSSAQSRSGQTSRTRFIHRSNSGQVHGQRLSVIRGSLGRGHPCLVGYAENEDSCTLTFLGRGIPKEMVDLAHPQRTSPSFSLSCQREGDLFLFVRTHKSVHRTRVIPIIVLRVSRRTLADTCYSSQIVVIHSADDQFNEMSLSKSISFLVFVAVCGLFA